MGLNKEQILAIVIGILIMIGVAGVIHLGVEGQKLADECRSKYGGTFENPYCSYIRDGNSHSKDMTNVALEGESVK